MDEASIPGVVYLGQNVGIIGAGNVGTTLGYALKQKGYSLAGVCCRTKVSSQKASRFLETAYWDSPEEVAFRSRILIVATPDRAIKEVAEKIAAEEGFFPGQVVLHTSGAHSSEELAPARKSGASIMSMHPLQTFPGVETGLHNLPGSYFTLEGDAEALPVGEELVRQMGGIPLTIDTEMKPVYHAAACVVCNYYVTLLHKGLEMMEAAGVSREKALPALMPLVEGTLSNVQKTGVPGALTGPVDRGDASTVQSHVHKLEEKLPHLRDLYCVLGRHTVDTAREKGTLSEDAARAVLKVLQGEQG